MEMDLSAFMAAMIENAGGEIRVPMSVYYDATSEAKAMTIDIEDDGQTIVFGLVSEVPDDLA